MSKQPHEVLRSTLDAFFPGKSLEQKGAGLALAKGTVSGLLSGKRTVTPKRLGAIIDHLEAVLATGNGPANGQQLLDQLRAAYRSAPPRRSSGTVEPSAPLAATGSDAVGDLLTSWINAARTFLDPGGSGAIYEPGRADVKTGFKFSEATGFLVADMAAVYGMTGDEDSLTMAIGAANWLTSDALSEEAWVLTRQYDKGLRGARTNPLSFDSGCAYLFDNAICLIGLVKLLSTGVGSGQERAEWERCADGIGRNLVAAADHAQLPAIVTARDGKRWNGRADRWSRLPGAAHLAKVGEALALWTASSSSPSKAAAAAYVIASRVGAEPDGRIITSPEGELHLHPMLYAAEALFAIGKGLKHDDLVGAATNAVEWALGHVGEDGMVAQAFDSTGHRREPRTCRTDALAQLLGLASRMISSGDLDVCRLDELAVVADEVMKKRQEDGSFAYGQFENGTEPLDRARHFWVTSFAYRSLLDHAAARAAAEAHVLILAGGEGSRCWPASCETVPKPMTNLFLGDRSLLQETANRIVGTGCVRPDRMYCLAGSKAVALAKEQFEAINLDPSHVIEEAHPEGTTAATRVALSQMAVPEDSVVVVSMADNLIAPPDAVRVTLLKGILAAGGPAAEFGTDAIISLGVRTTKHDVKYGHAVYTPPVAGAIPVSRFVEKPLTEEFLDLRGDERVAWDTGCIVASRRYLSESIGGRDGNLAGDVLADDDVDKGLVLFPALTSFLDVGTPDDSLRTSFLGAPGNRGGGNIVLGPDGSRSATVFVNARRNMVITDRERLDVVCLDDHLIIDSAVANVAVVMPLDRASDLPGLARQVRLPDHLKAYAKGGPEAQNAACHHIAQDSRSFESQVEHGLVVAHRCAPMWVKRDEVGLRVVGPLNDSTAANTVLGGEGIGLLVDLVRDRAEPRLARHLVDVTVVAEILSSGLGLQPDARTLLRLACVTHDIGGFLSDAAIAREREVDERITRFRLDPRHLDSRVVRELAAHLELTDAEQVLAEGFNDSVNSAVYVLRSPHLADYKHRADLVYLVTNQEHKALFRDPVPGLYEPVAGFRTVAAVLWAADIWVNTHEVWKHPLALGSFRRSPEDSAFALSLVAAALGEAASTDRRVLDGMIQMIGSRESALWAYTMDRLRVVDGSDGGSPPVDRPPSDEVLVDVLNGVAPTSLGLGPVLRAVEDDHRLQLLRLPIRMHAFGESALQTAARDLASELHSAALKLAARTPDERACLRGLLDLIS